MAVLIEALTLVVKKTELDIRYPGGTEAFLEAALQVANPPRFACTGDDHLINVSFYDPPHAEPCAILLMEHGFLEAEDLQAADFAIVDQRFGPTLPCDWLEWLRHKDGFTYAWLAGQESGDMAAPSGWTVDQSKALTRKDIRDEPGRMIKLAEENGLETWLDFETGEITTSLPHRDDSEGAQVSAPPTVEEDYLADFGQVLDDILTELDAKTALTPSGMLRIIRRTLKQRGMELGSDRKNRRVVTGIEIAEANFVTAISVFTAPRYMRLVTIIPWQIPKRRHVSLCEAIARANYGLPAGAFAMDMTDGELCFQLGVPLGDVALTTDLVGAVIETAAQLVALYEPAFLEVADGSDPGKAISEVESQ